MGRDFLGSGDLADKSADYSFGFVFKGRGAFFLYDSSYILYITDLHVALDQQLVYRNVNRSDRIGVGLDSNRN